MQAFIRYYKDSDMNYWAENTLDPSELAQFRAAQTSNSNLWQTYQDQGLYTVQDIQGTVHSIILDADIDIVIGQEMIMSPGVSFDNLALHPDYVYWLDQYNQATGGDPLVPLVQ